MQGSMTSPVEPGPSRYPVGHVAAERTRPRTSYYRTVGSDRTVQIAKALGWFSIGLGVVQLLAPRATARAAGIAEHPVLVRTVGLREIASGVGILSQRRPTGWLWSRVAGDAMDLALLGLAVASSNSRRSRVALVGAAVAGVAALDVMSSMEHSERHQYSDNIAAPDEINVEKSITINRPAEECYRFWRAFDNFPRFMRHLESVTIESDTRSHWIAKAPVGTTVEWDADITIDEPGKMIAWSSVKDADVENAGVVTFEPAAGGRGTVVQVELQYRPPGGSAGALIAKLFGEEPSQQIDGDLRRFKQLIETGEITTTEGQSSGHRSPIARLFRKGEPG